MGAFILERVPACQAVYTVDLTNCPLNQIANRGPVHVFMPGLCYSDPSHTGLYMALTLRPAIARLLLGCVVFFLGGCASSPEVDVMLAESPNRAVYLERILDRSFQAAHPIRLKQDTLARILKGILVKEDQGLLRSLVAGQAPVTPAFTEEEIRYLAPLMMEALEKAAPDQQVGFRLLQSGSALSQHVGAAVGSSQGGPQKETTRGSLYAYGRSLYLTLTEYRFRSEHGDGANLANRQLPDSTGLANRTLFFVPEAAKRPDSFRGKSATDNTLVIDYELLATLPDVQGTVNSSAAPASDKAQPSSRSGEPPQGTEKQLRALEEDMRQKNVELEELRKELRDIRQQLGNPPTGAPTPSNKAKPLSKDR